MQRVSSLTHRRWAALRALCLGALMVSGSFTATANTAEPNAAGPNANSEQSADSRPSADMASGTQATSAQATSTIPTSNVQTPLDVPTVHGLAIYGEPAHKPGFTHFPYVNPEAPVGGRMTRAAIGSFDSTNPFILKGNSVAGLNYFGGLIYDTLMIPSADEPFTEYGLLASGVRLAEDRSAIEFDIDPRARFHDGVAVTAEDVVFTYRLLKDEGLPFFKSYYHDVTGVSVIDADTVRFEMAPGAARELPLIIGQLPVLPEHYWKSRDFTRATLELPLGSGPYRMASLDAGRQVRYERVDDYWGKDLPVNKGRHNIQTLVYDYYRDQTVSLEAFKAGSIDLHVESSAKNWATAYDTPALHEGRLKKLEVPDSNPAGMQGFVLNERRERFQDPRVREALALVFDFDWINRNLFYGAYQQTHSYFENSDMAADGMPTGKELALLEPFKDELPSAVFDKPLPIDEPQELRPRLRKALGLLREAGYEVVKGQLVSRSSGKPLTLEVLNYDTQFERIIQPWIRNLARIGIKARIRTVDVNQYINRRRSFDFDVVVGSYPQSNSPGSEQREYWTSDYADVAGSRNLIGLKSPVVDALTDALIQAQTREDLLSATRALDRVLRWGFHVVPQWHLAATRIALWNKFGYPQPFPEYQLSLDSWWIEPDKDASLEPGE
ncbi:extracellular solute-binding protein [Cobetia amphilecti]|uniref:extracellular solute-binding protein n=1 Tax=Cobetia amphilecti TaxID=1055104 RepID=UPI0026E490D0|nr:extracellular solute-binding protein [Cobetia amphilecti]MDO6814464.1 extracellular solute-binding protein [Cobetia amphilecti]